jgi:hypothetical protein
MLYTRAERVFILKHNLASKSFAAVREAFSSAYPGKEVLNKTIHRSSAREHTMFAPAQLLRNWRKQRPSNQCELESSVTREVGRVCFTGAYFALDFIFVP